MRRILLLFALLVPSVLFAQCGTTPYFFDQSEKQVMGGRIDTKWAVPMTSLQQQGAEVITYVAPATTNLDAQVFNLIRNCALWTNNPQATKFDEMAKSTLIVLAFSPSSHLSGLYYGSAWHHALDGQWNRIRLDYMNPRFKDGDFIGALAVGMAQLNARVVASKDEALHPVSNNTTYQATNLEPIARVAMIFIFAGLGIFALFFLVHAILDNRKRKRELAEARDEAIASRAKVSAALIELKYLVADKPQQTDWDTVSDSFNKYNNGRLNPDDETLPLYTYQSIRRDYDAMANRLARIKRELLEASTPKEGLDEESTPAYPSSGPGETKDIAAAVGATTTGSVARKHHHTREDNSTNIFAPVIVGGSTYVEPSAPSPTSSPSPSWEPPAPDPIPEPEPEHHHHSAESGGSSSWDFGSSSSSDSGGSSSWDSGSSSSDSGGSSSFDSGSSGSDNGGSGSW